MQLILKGEVPITVFLKNNVYTRVSINSAKGTYFDDYIKCINKYLSDVLDIKNITFGENHRTVGKKKKENLSEDEKEVIKEIEIKIKFLFDIFSKYDEENKNMMINISKLPDFPKDALIVKFILQKNVSKINKLMNNSIR